MRRLQTVLLLIAACFAWPAAAVPTLPPESEAPATSAAIDADMLAYGEWMARILAMQTPVQDQLAALGPAWRTAQADGATLRQLVERVRPTVARMLAVIDAANREIEALEPPEFVALDLPEDVRPAAIAREILAVNRQIRTAMEAFTPMLDAIQNEDMAAMQASGTRLLASFGLIFESQIVFARATQAAAPRDDPAWALGNFKLLYLRTGARLFAAWKPFQPPRVDEALPGDMMALADELEVNAEQGAQRLDAELETSAAELAEAQGRGDADQVMVLRRSITTFTVARGYFPLSREMAAILRAEAVLVRGQPVTQESTVRVFGRLRPIRVRMDEIGRQTVAGMTDPQ